MFIGKTDNNQVNYTKDTNLKWTENIVRVNSNLVIYCTSTNALWTELIANLTRVIKPSKTEQKIVKIKSRMKTEDQIQKDQLRSMHVSALNSDILKAFLT